MNKKLASTGSTLNKNMTNTEYSLTLNNLTCTSACLTKCTVDYIKAEPISCVTSYIPTNLPIKKYAGTMYFDIVTRDFYIYDSADWNSVTLTNIPTNP